MLIGRPNDVLTGGAGQDRFVFNPQFGRETVTDFHPGGDLTQFDRSLFPSVDAVLSHAAQVGADTVISLPGEVLTLDNVALSDLGARDFLFV